MKKLLPLLLAGCLAGCMSTKSDKKPDPSDKLAAEAKLNEKLPLAVQPESISKENGVAKARELEEELTRDAKRMAAARSTPDQMK